MHEVDGNIDTDVLMHIYMVEIALNIAQHTSSSPYVGGCSLLPEDTDLTEIIIDNVVPIVFHEFIKAVALSKLEAVEEAPVGDE